VHVDWGVQGMGEDRQFFLHWRDTDGAPVTAPVASSAGTRLIKAGLAGARDGSVTLDFAPEGLRCELRANLQSVQEEL
jgi:two-component sensor histidine kinase